MITVSLNTDEHGMCFIGKHAFSFKHPGPIQLDVNKLNSNELNQFTYNYRRGVLHIDNVEELLTKAQELPASSSRFTTTKEKPTQHKTEPHDIIEQEELAFRKLLRSKIGDIKDTVAVMSPAKIRKLAEFEKETKNRKKLLAYLQEILDQHTNSVTKKVGTQDAILFAPANLGLERKYLENVSNVIESDMEQIVLNPMNIKE